MMKAWDSKTRLFVRKTRETQWKNTKQSMWEVIQTIQTATINRKTEKENVNNMKRIKLKIKTIKWGKQALKPREII